MRDVRAFNPIWGATTRVSNSATATAALVLPADSDTVALTNSSATATVFVRVTTYEDQGAPTTGDAPTATTDMPILPLSQIRIFTAAQGTPKLIRTIASAADGFIYVTPGKGV